MGDGEAADGFLPREPLLETLLEYDVRVTVGTDSHEPGDFEARVPALCEYVGERGIDPVSPV